MTCIVCDFGAGFKFSKGRMDTREVHYKNIGTTL